MALVLSIVNISTVIQPPLAARLKKTNRANKINKNEMLSFNGHRLTIKIKGKIIGSIKKIIEPELILKYKLGMRVNMYGEIWPTTKIPPAPNNPATGVAL
jgi:hypothetical protein